jgi:hypothetical protein
MMPGQCHDNHCVEDAAGNTRLQPRGAGDENGANPETEAHPDAVRPPGQAGSEVSPPVTVSEASAGADADDEIMRLMHESVGKAIVSVPAAKERVFYTVDGSDPVPGAPHTFECGVNPGFDGSREQVCVLSPQLLSSNDTPSPPIG